RVVLRARFHALAQDDRLGRIDLMGERHRDGDRGTGGNRRKRRGGSEECCCDVTVICGHGAGHYSNRQATIPPQREGPVARRLGGLCDVSSCTATAVEAPYGGTSICRPASATAEPSGAGASAAIDGSRNGASITAPSTFARTPERTPFDQLTSHPDPSGVTSGDCTLGWLVATVAVDSTSPEVERRRTLTRSAST